MATPAVSYIDAHCHLQDARIVQGVDGLLEEARTVGLRGWVCNGTCEADWDSVLRLADRHPHCVLPSFGLHPWAVSERSPDWLAHLEEKLLACPRAAVGEVGLHKGKVKKGVDGGPPAALASIEEQLQVMRQQMELAQRLQRPVSVHCVNAYGHLQRLLSDVGPFPSGVVLHSFVGKPSTVPALAAGNAYFSISGFMCSSSPSKAEDILKAIPLERLLLETDCPDATPPQQADAPLLLVPRPEAPAPPPQELHLHTPAEEGGTPSSSLMEGGEGMPGHQQRPLNHPGNITEVCTFVAKCLDLPSEVVARATFKNAMKVFTYFS